MSLTRFYLVARSRPGSKFRNGNSSSTRLDALCRWCCSTSSQLWLRTTSSHPLGGTPLSTRCRWRLRTQSGDDASPAYVASADDGCRSSNGLCSGWSHDRGPKLSRSLTIDGHQCDCRTWCKLIPHPSLFDSSQELMSHERQN